MSTRTTHTSDSGLYYITFTCFEWLRLFKLTNAYDVVYKWFSYLNAKHFMPVHYMELAKQTQGLVALRQMPFTKTLLQQKYAEGLPLSFTG